MLIHERRPTRLEDMIGQERQLAPLLAYREKHGRYPAVILLEGASGCGKTTLAKIIGGEDCPPAINAADKNGVEDMRKLTDDMRHTPMIGTRRVALLNEAQGLSAAAVRVLLDPLENVPDFSQWIFTSMDAERLDKAFLDRCFRVTLRPLNSVTEVMRLLEPVGGTREDAERFLRTGVTAPRAILAAYEASNEKTPATAEAFDAVRALYKGEVDGVKRFTSKAKPDELIEFYYVALGYGRSILAKDHQSARATEVLNALVSVPSTSDVTLRSAAVVLRVAQALNYR